MLVESDGTVLMVATIAMVLCSSYSLLSTTTPYLWYGVYVSLGFPVLLVAKGVEVKVCGDSDYTLRPLGKRIPYLQLICYQDGHKVKVCGVCDYKPCAIVKMVPGKSVRIPWTIAVLIGKRIPYLQSRCMCVAIRKGVGPQDPARKSLISRGSMWPKIGVRSAVTL